jgi:hypothetical protein
VQVGRRGPNEVVSEASNRLAVRLLAESGNSMLSCAKQILESRDSAGWRPGGRPGKGLAERSLCKLAVRLTIHGEPFSHGAFAIKKANPSSKRV